MLHYKIPKLFYSAAFGIFFAFLLSDAAILSATEPAEH